MNARSEQREGPSLACVKPGRALAAAALLVAVTLQSVQAAERGKHSREYVRFKREYESLPNNLDDPERWQVTWPAVHGCSYSVHVFLPASRGDDRRPHSQVDQLIGSVRHMRTRGVTR